MARKMALGLLMLVTGLIMITAGWVASGSGAAAAAPQNDGLVNLIRLHVVANSDSEEDQALKRAVRDVILEEVTPLFKQAASPEEARAAITLATPRIERAAGAVIASWGKDYAVSAKLGRFSFPGKAYGVVFLPAGEYTALKVLIGEGKGANWWCVLFPPMCFVDWSTGIVLEPRPGTAGAETVAVPRHEALTLVDDEELERAPVRARLAILEWAKGRTKVPVKSKAPGPRIKSSRPDGQQPPIPRIPFGTRTEAM